jgi:hypothetical protein
MNRRHVRLCIAALSLATVASLPMTSHAAYRCANPQGVGEQRACAMAAVGPEELRRFIFRTRGIYTLYFFDFVNPGE